MAASLERSSRHREETEGQTQDQVEGFYVHAGLGAPWNQSWLMWAGKGKCGALCWNYFLSDPTPDKR